jgi:dCMP deaminase
MSNSNLKKSYSFESYEDLMNSGFLKYRNWSVKKQILKSKDDQKISIFLKTDDSERIEKSDDFLISDKKMLERDMIYLRMSSVWGENSYSKRMQVGCLIVKDKSIISDGYNGSPSGFPNICEDKDMNTLPYVLHAEANAITKLAKSTQSSEGSTIYVTLSPCFECSKLIVQSGIKRLVFKDLYRKTESIPFLIEAGIEIFKISNPY